MPQLLHSISFHCSVTVADKVDFDFSSRDPISSQDVKSFDSKVKWEPNDQVRSCEDVLLERRWFASLAPRILRTF